MISFRTQVTATGAWSTRSVTQFALEMAGGKITDYFALNALYKYEQAQFQSDVGAPHHRVPRSSHWRPLWRPCWQWPAPQSLQTPFSVLAGDATYLESER
jgi:hypothetical protein